MKNILSSLTHKTTLISLLILAGIVFSLYSILFYVITLKTREASVLIQELDKEILKEQEFLILKKTLAITVKEREKLNSYFVKNDSIVNLIEQIESLGKHAGVGVSFDSISLSGDGQDLLDLNFVSNGAFADTFYFLSLLESVPLALSFKRVFIAQEESTKPESSELAGVWVGTFAMRVSSFLNEK